MKKPSGVRFATICIALNLGGQLIGIEGMGIPFVIGLGISFFGAILLGQTLDEVQGL